MLKYSQGKFFLVPKMATDFLNEEVAAILLQRNMTFFFFLMKKKMVINLDECICSPRASISV